MLDLFKKLFSRTEPVHEPTPNQIPVPEPLPEPSPVTLPDTPSLLSSDQARPTRLCKSCGKPFPYDPSWEHVPNYCKVCKTKYQEAHRIYRVWRKCRSCGKSFSFPSSVRHYPGICGACRNRQKQE